MKLWRLNEEMHIKHLKAWHRVSTESTYSKNIYHMIMIMITLQNIFTLAINGTPQKPSWPRHSISGLKGETT